MTRSRLGLLLLLLPTLAWGQVTPSPQRVLSDLPVTHREYAIADYGAKCDGSTDDGPAIQAAANAAAAAPAGGVVTGYGTCAVATAVVVNSARVTFSSKHLGDGDHDVGSNDNGWTLKWTGTAGGTMVQIAAIAGASNQALFGNGAQGITFDCSNSAAIGLQLLSVKGGYWNGLYFVECTTAGLDTAPVGNAGSLGEASDVQNNQFHGIRSRILLSTGIAVRLRGSPNGSANTSFDTFYSCAFLYKNGVGVQLQDTDNVGFYDVQMVRAASGTGIGVEVTGDSAGSSRSDFFYDLSPGAGGVTIRGTETNPTAVKNIQLIGYDITNSPPNPVYGTGVTGVTIYKENGFLAGAGIVGGGGGLDNQGAVFSGNHNDLVTAYARLPNTLYSQYVYNSSQDGTWYDDGTGKWLIRQDASHNLNVSRQAGTGQFLIGAPFVTSFGLASGGTTFTLGSGTGACGTTSTLTGGATGGSFLCTGTAGASTIVVNLPNVASGFHGWTGFANDDTSKVSLGVGGGTSNSITISGTIATTSDKVTFVAFEY